ncbi:hypothetical protein BPNPMPFG_006802 (plasmid) [Mesorhizobium sp. AR07]|uniref:Uncharacterized protein n=1 Tax=Mesorhizobium huakuii TaxID=28104 RepID=A0A7G6T5C9_9HYPH|nr:MULTISPECIES: hypothetical protein [Mesorhizobium]QND61961.1 hypothetical protein HB778_38075 [Mesorhizobium huakuii]QND69529.1 hypothetical protein HB777_38480 [Mesorhizobium loti]UVK48998.1 hypothetical protein BPNPMPFG_006659 [Mesorhizobium sp. AR07]UVK49106.1 hypothetical protein BPNPMPFG_006802 [Mesorhizobium sp. AR07]
MKTLPPPSRLPALRQLIMPLDSRALDGLTRAQRAVAVASLAKLLMAAAGVAEKEMTDDGR